jgi:hypothetical protein
MLLALACGGAGDERRAQTDMLSSDLLSHVVAAGAGVETEVRLPRGARVVGSINYTGAANGRFTLVSVEHRVREDSTILVVKAHNFSTVPTAFSADFNYSVPRGRRSDR